MLEYSEPYRCSGPSSQLKQPSGRAILKDRPDKIMIMNIEAAELEKAVLLKVSGRMDAENAHEFDQACNQWIAKGARHLIADLDGLQYVGSMGLRSFLAVAQKLQSMSGSLILCGLHGLPRQVFEITRLIGVFPIYDSAQQAIATL